MNVDLLYSSILSSSFGLSMGAIWQHLSVETLTINKSDEDKVVVFFDILSRLMNEGHLKLARDGKFLSGDVNEQVNVIRRAWPACPEEDDLDGFGFWFLTTSPAGVVWITPDGQEIWT